LLSANPDLEIATKDGDTPLLRAVRSRNAEIVQLLLDKKAKVSAMDKKGDTVLHVAMRARSKGIVEILLRNPKNSQLLYRPNKQGETAYNIDINHQKAILGQIFGARKLMYMYFNIFSNIWFLKEYNFFLHILLHISNYSFICYLR
jgi:ankyrin repeat-rich membrane spanning protein